MSDKRGDGGADKGGQILLYNKEEAIRWDEEAERARAECNMIWALIGFVFSTRKPRDVVAGTSSGLKTAVRGIGVGVGALVALPYIGWKQGGGKGLVKGVGTGVAACLGSAAVGTVIGSGQIVRGVYHTPNAVLQKSRGQVWNAEDRKWEADWYSLPEEAKAVLGDKATSKIDAENTGGSDDHPASSSTAPGRPTRKVVDTQLYDVLEVPTNATAGEIRRSFYKKSLAMHPDKNPDNPEATRMFQAVSDAYRVLEKEETRRVYDEHGLNSAAESLPKIEPAVFFAALFGSHHFEAYVGRLRLAQDVDGDLQSLIRDVVTGSEEESPSFDMLKIHRAQKKMKQVQLEREVSCALALVERLSPLVGDFTPKEREVAVAEWEAKYRQEAANLAKVTCGIEMLYLVGWVYSNRAQQFFAGGVLRRVMARVQGRAHLAKSKAKVVGTAGRTAYTVAGLAETAEKKKSLAEKAEKPTSPRDAHPAGPSDEAADGHSRTPSAPSAPFAPPPEMVPPTAAEETRSAFASSPGAYAAAGPAVGAQRTSPTSGRAGERTQAEESAHPQDVPTYEDPPPGTGGLPLGSIVSITGLVSAADLNDEMGMVCGLDPTNGRYLVQVLPNGGLKALKPENLILIESPSDFTEEETFKSANAAGTGPDESEMDAFKVCMPLVHDTLWSVTALDIEFTLTSVIERVLRDMSVEKIARRQRADALLRLGNILQEPYFEEKKRTKSEAKVSRTVSPTKSEGMALLADDASSSGGKRSVLARFKPRAPWRGSERQEEKLKLAEAKQKRIECAMQMMVVGASTEEVDELLSAKAAMEEMDS